MDYNHYRIGINKDNKDVIRGQSPVILTMNALKGYIVKDKEYTPSILLTIATFIVYI